ncbi:MAG: hypothetical protein IPO27_16100 [Bacteroidetes bacterium]|nr:hypothetical protein [Bacteroidota bacterium]
MKRYITFISCLLLIVFVCCKPKKEVAAATSVDYSDSIFLIIDKSPCFGACPTYKMIIYNNGYATMRASKNVPQVGNFNRRFSPQEIEQLSKKIEEIRFFDLKDEYNDTLIMDLPFTTIAAHRRGAVKSILCRFEIPDPLNNFVMSFDTLIGSPVWKLMKSPFGDD